MGKDGGLVGSLWSPGICEQWRLCSTHYQRHVCHCEGGQSLCIRVCATLLDLEMFLSKRLDLRLYSFSMVKAPAQFPVPPTSVGYFLALTSIVAGSLPAAWQFGCI